MAKRNSPSDDDMRRRFKRRQDELQHEADVRLQEENRKSRRNLLLNALRGAVGKAFHRVSFYEQAGLDSFGGIPEHRLKELASWQAGHLVRAGKTLRDDGWVEAIDQLTGGVLERDIAIAIFKAIAAKPALGRLTALLRDYDLRPVPYTDFTARVYHCLHETIPNELIELDEIATGDRLPAKPMPEAVGVAPVIEIVGGDATEEVNKDSSDVTDADKSKAVPKGDGLRERKQFDAETRALAVMAQHPEITTIVGIAKEAGCTREHLSKNCPRFLSAWNVAKKTRKQPRRIVRGKKDKSGSVEAWQNDDENECEVES